MKCAVLTHFNQNSMLAYVEFVLAPQHRTSCDPEITTKEDFDY